MDELSLFWKSLSRVTQCENIIILPKSAALFPSKMTSIYVRQSYVELFKIILDKLSTPLKSGMVISGTPGIGKTIFLFYILWRLSKIPKIAKTIILHRQEDGGRIFVFNHDDCFTTRDLNDIDNYLLEKSTWYLTDLKDSPGN